MKLRKRWYSEGIIGSDLEKALIAQTQFACTAMRASRPHI
jgi:hypothetical protein